MSDLAGRVVLRRQPEGLGLHPQVDVLADDNHLAVATPLAHLVGQRDDAVVCLDLGESFTDPTRVGLAHLDEQPPAPLAEGKALGEQPVARESIQLPDELARLDVD